MSTKALISETTEVPPPKKEGVSYKKAIGIWSAYMSGILAILQMTYGIGLVLFFFFSFDVNYEKWEVPGAMVLTMVFTGFVVQGSALLVIIGHIQRQAKYVYMGCVFPFLECTRTSYIVLKSLYQIIFEYSAKVMSDQTWLNTVNSLSFLGFLGWFFFISLLVHLKTAHVIEHNEDEADEK
ncbi:hypothetical protein PRIPAC_95304 [Pristionchus pacificus]|uniref:Uncharacterized protein n=1 Tax=Pristionchus pacificus TaxID=54126 RepID=A0A454XPD0_PRIPA|nr:hypothetical protein PRIPAC_95304 [Pristionchus pacificus]|eukprot:PDM63418.1 hypothetical protein PRIPAC_53775 [Pristionchus pacificus]